MQTKVVFPLDSGFMEESHSNTLNERKLIVMFYKLSSLSGIAAESD